MGRILAIDYGHKRVGLAASDELQIIATGLTTVETDKCIAFLKDYVSKENVSSGNGGRSPSQRYFPVSYIR